MEFYHYEKSKQFTIRNFGEIQIKGFSRSTLRTGFIILPYRIVLDAGLTSPIKPNMILITQTGNGW